MNITLKQLNVFICITQEKTITAAAEKLCLSKPAVSMALAELEKQLGNKLFERKNNRLLLNELGKMLLPLADEQLSRGDAIKQLFAQTNTLSGKLKIGTSNTVGNQVMPFLLSDFRKFADHSEQSLCIDNTALICSKLKEYELDVALVEGAVHDPELLSHRWLSDKMVITCNATHPLAAQKNLHLADLEAQTWILRESGSGSRDFFIRHIGDYLRDYKIALELNTTEAIINCTSVGLGLSCMSKLAARHALNDKRLLSLDIDLEMQRDYWLVWHKDKYQSPLLKSFLEFVKSWQPPF